MTSTSPSLHQQWACTACTFVSAHTSQQCEMCGGDKPPPPPLPRHRQQGELSLDVSDIGALLVTWGKHLPDQLGVRFSFQPRNVRFGEQCTLTISADDEDALGVAAMELAEIQRDPVAFKDAIRQTKVHVFVDDSNVFWGALNRGRPPLGSPASPFSSPSSSTSSSSFFTGSGGGGGGGGGYASDSSDASASSASSGCSRFVDIDALIRVVQRGRWAEKQLVVGSGYPGAGRWGHYKKAGFEVQVMQRAEGGKEVGVDDTLHAAILNEARKNFREPRTMVLVTGDGNANGGRVSFPQAAEVALQSGWKVEVWAWNYSTSAAWRSFQDAYGASGNFSLMSLDVHAAAIIREGHPAVTLAAAAAAAPVGAPAAAAARWQPAGGTGGASAGGVGGRADGAAGQQAAQQQWRRQQAQPQHAVQPQQQPTQQRQWPRQWQDEARGCARKSKATPCRRWAASGTCHLGDACAFGHPMLAHCPAYRPAPCRSGHRVQAPHAHHHAPMDAEARARALQSQAWMTAAGGPPGARGMAVPEPRRSISTEGASLFGGSHF